MARKSEEAKLIFSPGTQVVLLREIKGTSGKVLHSRGAVGAVVKSPVDLQHAYRVRFPDGDERSVPGSELTTLSKFKESDFANGQAMVLDNRLMNRVIFQCVIGSQAYGLAGSDSDIDRRGIYLPTAEQHWSLSGVPEQLECHETQEVYWELQKFVSLALKANPNVLECLFSPMIEKATPLAQSFLDLRSHFLSRLVYQTFNGYVMSQFRKIQADIRNQGKVKWKHVMHLIRLLMSGITVLREGYVRVDVGEQRDQLLAIKRGEISWEQADRWRLELHAEFDRAFETTRLPDRPNYEIANQFLITARRAALQETLP